MFFMELMYIKPNFVRKFCYKFHSITSYAGNCKVCLEKQFLVFQINLRKKKNKKLRP